MESTEETLENIVKPLFTMLRKPAPIINSDDNLYRVMVSYTVTTDEYRMFVGDDLVRYFNGSDLPNEIRSRLAIIRAAGEKYFRDSYVSHTETELTAGFTNACFPPEFNDIGWQITPPPFVWYCVVIPEKLLDSLRGEP